MACPLRPCTRLSALSPAPEARKGDGAYIEIFQFCGKMFAGMTSDNDKCSQCNLAVGALVLARAQPVPVTGRLHAQGLAPSGARNRALEPVLANIEFPLSPVFLYPDRPTHANEHVG